MEVSKLGEIHALPAAIAAIICATPALAADFQDPATIDHAVAQFTGQPTGSEGGARLPVDRRLKLAQCPLALALEWYGGNQAVAVRCPVAGGWRIFVPIAARPTEAKSQAIVVRGETVAVSIQGSGFTVTRQGEALDTGAADDWVRVRLTGEKREPVRARVIAPGKVGLQLP